MFTRYTLSCVLKIISILLIICYAKYVVCFTLPISSLIIVKKLLSLIMMIMRKNNDNDNAGNKGNDKDDGYNL